MVGIRALSALIVWALASIGSAAAQPSGYRPYIDRNVAPYLTRETTGFGPLAQGKTPSGRLLCREGEALVGVSFKRGRVVDRVLIHCAAVRPVVDRGRRPLREGLFGFLEYSWSHDQLHPPMWDEHPAYPDAAAGGGGGERVTENICQPGLAITGMAAQVNMQNQIVDLAFECAKLIGGFQPGPTTGGIDWFTERCQPTLVFAVFPVDLCLTDVSRQALRGMPAGGSPYRHWPEDRFGVPWMYGVADDQKCHQYAAVGLIFVEEAWVTLRGITAVVTGLKLVCIGHPAGYMRPRPPGRR